MDSAGDLIDFYNDVEVIMPTEDVKISPSCYSNYEDGFTLNEGAFMYGRVLDPDPMVVNTQGPFPELLLSLCDLNLEVPAELAPPARPIRKVIHKATRARAGG